MQFKRWCLYITAIVSSLLLCACGSTNSSEVSSQLTDSGTEAVVAPRIAIDLNSDWKFIRDDMSGAEQPMLDDSSWQSVTLPHTWNNLDGEDGGNDYYRGPAWYRRHLTLTAAEQGKSTALPAPPPYMSTANRPARRIRECSPRLDMTSLRW